VPKPRRPFKFWTMAATSVLGTLVGLALAVLGDTAGQRLIGVALALLAGLAPAPYILGPLLSGSGPGTVLCERVRTSAGSETAFVFPTPRAKRIATLARAVGVAGGCAALLAAAGGWVLIVVTALAAVYLGVALAGRARQRLVLTPTGSCSPARSRPSSSRGRRSTRSGSSRRRPRTARRRTCSGSPPPIRTRWCGRAASASAGSRAT
jgi:hypothetical protein